MTGKVKNSGTIIALLVIVVFALLAWYGIIYYEDGEDSYLNVLSRGMLTGGPETMPNPFGVWVGLTHIITWLFEWKINFDWYAAFEAIGYGLLIFQLVRLAPVLYCYLEKIAGKVLAIFILVSCAIIFSENLFFWAFTRVSLLLTGISLLRIWLCITPEKDFASIPKGFLAFNLFCFAYAALIRSEPAALNLVVWLPLIGLGMLNGVPLKNYRVFLIHVVIVVAISVFLNIPFNKTDSSYLAYRRYQFSLLDFRQSANSIRALSEKDSMMYLASHKSFSSDSRKLTPEFLDKIGVMPMDKTPAAIPYYLKNLSSAPAKIRNGWGKLVGSNPGLGILYLILLVAGGLLIIYKVADKFKWYLLSQLFLLFLCLAVTSFMKMENRVLIPLLWCFIIQNLVWCYGLTKSSAMEMKTSAPVFLVTVVLLLPIVLIDGGKAYGRWCYKRKEDIEMSRLVAEVNTLPQKTIVINISGIWKFNLHPFEPVLQLHNKKPISFDNFIISFLPKYGPYMKSVCGSSDVEDIAKYLEQNKKDVLVISSTGRMELIKSYLEVVYGIMFNYEIADPGTLHKKNDVILYRLI
jgi:hypothetical protein